MIWPFGNARAENPVAQPAPVRPVWAVGDIHGCADKLDTLLDAIATAGGARDPLVFLGDYADRGPDSAGVFLRLRALSDAPGRAVTCLMGNHDRMLLDFLDDPVGAGPRFLGNGGQETLLSYGIFPAATGALRDRLTGQATALAAAIGDLREWLLLRPLWHRSGTCIFVHAQTQPPIPMEDQPEAVLLWARPPKRQQPRSDGAWVIHGHTVVPEPRVQAGHIAIDTGAYRGGPLTAVRLEAGTAPRFVQA
jgi:serine/threonine protein phosphatase 1